MTINQSIKACAKFSQTPLFILYVTKIDCRLIAGKSGQACCFTGKKKPFHLLAGRYHDLICMISKTALTFAEALLLKCPGERLPKEVYMVGNF